MQAATTASSSTGSWTSVGARGHSKSVAEVADLHLDNGDLDVAVTVGDGRIVLHLAGELDLATAPRLRMAIDGHRDPAIATLVLDLARLTFIDSSGLHEIVVALKRQRESGGDLLLRHPSPSTRRVLDIVGLSTIITIE